MSAGAARRWQRLAPTSDRAPALWRIDLRLPLPEAALADLSSDELARARRLRGGALARRYLGAHWALRCLIAEPAGRAPSALAFETGRHGKPRLRGGEGPGFSLSRRGDVAVLAIGEARAEIGVDVELDLLDGDPLALAEDVFTSSERRVLAGLASVDRPAAFLRGWTRKEACLKALGCGLTLDPRQVEVGLGGPGSDSLRLRLPVGADGADVELASLDLGAGDEGSTTIVISWARWERPDLRSSRA
jgi:4'-phosphopantetheinyl transferase